MRYSTGMHLFNWPNTSYLYTKGPLPSHSLAPELLTRLAAARLRKLLLIAHSHPAPRGLAEDTEVAQRPLAGCKLDCQGNRDRHHCHATVPCLGPNVCPWLE